MAKTKARYRRRRGQNRLGMILATFVVLLLFVAISVRSMDLLSKRDEYREKIATLEAQIEYEEARSEEIASYEKYTKTRKYIEDTAKSKLGLVYPGEIIFREEK